MKALLLSLLLMAAPAAAEQPSVGDLFDAPPMITEKGEDTNWQFRGWRHVGRDADSPDYPGHFAVFERNGQIMVAATEKLTRSNVPGDDGIQKILAIKIVSPSEGEEQKMSCGFLTLTPAVAFYNAKTGVARGIFVLSGAIHEERWFVNQKTTLCYNGD